ncbi:MAG: DUF11 domain-containing protein [Candidatus Thiodiazotropha sp. (ex Lucinoma borealis)]|nr:DUF11 domain-containing protein [Candidatus Thiodiazotropha sp. (ex Lucinoma borealis)]
MGKGIVAVVCLVLITAYLPAHADIALFEPQDGQIYTIDPCPVAPCAQTLPLRLLYNGPQAERIQVVFTRQEDGRRHERALCFFDQIEGISCPQPPNNFPGSPDQPLGIQLTEGTWTAIPQAIVNGASEFGDSITITLQFVDLPPADPVRLSRVEPLRAGPRILLREDDPATTDEDPLYSQSDPVRIIGQNLDETTNPFLEVYLTPVPLQEPSFTSNSALPNGDWCLYEAEIDSAVPLSGGESQIEVLMPTLPATTADLCIVPPRPEGSIFQTEWRWMIRDKWIRDNREHATWAINSPRDVPWKDTPNFTVTKPQYPLIDGFGFKNEGTDASYREFLTVFANNAYVCVDCIPLVGCACALPRVPDPLYHLLWHPIYKKVINSTKGSCNGMAATSLLMAREKLQTEGFSPIVRYPAGFETETYQAEYKDTNFCSPYCAPPKPDNLWAEIRKNHGVQISREFLLVILETLGEAIFDPDSGQLFSGVPNETKQRIANAPLNHVACFFEFGNGHCVTPYAVAGDTIRIYDNNNPLDVTREIIVSGGDYSYPGRAAEGESLSSGNALVAFPISIWENGRNILGLSDIQSIFQGDVVKFLLAVAVGDAEMEISTSSGTLGFETDGTRTDFVPGGMLVPLMGPADQEQRNPMAVVTMNQDPPSVQLHAKGSSYHYQTAAGGVLFQIASQSASPGNTDRVQLALEDQNLAGLAFTPEADANAIQPQIGLNIAEGERALFRYSGVQVLAGNTVGFAGDKESHSATFKNDSGMERSVSILLDRTGGDYVRTTFGPIEVPNGAVHELILQDWPDVGTATSTLDLDGDGTPESTTTLTGQPLPMPENFSSTADLAVSINTSSTSASQPDAVSISVRNIGPDSAVNAVVRVSSPESASWELVQSTGGRCQALNEQFECSYESLASGALQSVQLRSSTPGGLKTATASVYSTSFDPEQSNDSLTIKLSSVTTESSPVVDSPSSGRSSPARPTTPWLIAAIIALFIIIVFFVLRRRSS